METIESYRLSLITFQLSQLGIGTCSINLKEIHLAIHQIA